MELTPAEQRELAALRRWDAQRREEEQDRVTTRLTEPRQVEEGIIERGLSFARTVGEEARDFSLSRVIVGSLKDGVEDLLETSVDLSGALKRRYEDLGASPGVASFLSADFILPNVLEAVDDDIITTNPQGERNVSFGKLKGEDQAGAVETFTREIGSFLVPYTGIGKAIGVARAATLTGRIGQATAQGAFADFVSQDTDEGNFANLVQDTFGIDNAVLDSLAAEEDDSELLARTKAAIAAAPIGIAFDTFAELGAKAVKLYRDKRGTVAEANAIVDALKRDYSIPKRPADIPTGEVDEAGQPIMAPAPTPPENRYSFSLALDEENPETFEDVVSFLQRASATDVPEDDLVRLSNDILLGDTGSLATRLGIDPRKLDYSVFDDPERLAKMHGALVEVIETISKKLGRSGQRVSESQVIQGARALATSADVLRGVFRRTKKLPEVLTASTIFVKLHGERLVALAEAAAAEITDGTAGSAWLEFTEALHRHAYYVGALRGASSEVGRALRALRTTKAMFQKREARVVKLALGDEGAGDAAVNTPKGEILQEDIQTYILSLNDDASRLDALARLISHGADVGEMSQFVRTKSLTGLRGIDARFRETVGNYFASTTALLNIVSGFSLMGIRTMAKWLTALDKATIIRKTPEARLEARRAVLDAWAYTDGIVSAFSEANANVIALLQRELGGEMLTHVQALDGTKISKQFGLEQLSKKSAGLVIEGTLAASRANYERADVVNQRLIAMSPEVRERWLQKTEELTGPRFFVEALKAMVRLTGEAINIYGTASRSGTILAINAPDQWVGTLAARAGAQSTAVRLATSDAIEHGLTGDDFSKYVKARMMQLTKDFDGVTDTDPFTEGAKYVVTAAGDAEARAILFQDALETPGFQELVYGLKKIPIVSSLVLPFVQTPLRILERTFYDHTPIGVFNARLRKAIAAGGPEGDEALARIALGSLAVAVAWKLAEDRVIVGRDGAWKGSGRLDRPSYSIKIGDDHFEFSRIDPLGMLLGMAADMQQALEDQADDPDAPDQVEGIMAAFASSFAANALSKTWLLSLKDLTDLAGATSDEEFAVRWKRYVGSWGARVIPGAGLQRDINRIRDPYVREAHTIMENFQRNTLGATSLRIKRDSLGNPIDNEGLERLPGGLVLFPGDSPLDDTKVDHELARLAFNLPRPKWTQLGVKLTASQMSRFLEIRGHVVKKSFGGRKMTLNEALRALVEHPGYQALPSDAAKVLQVRDVMEGFTPLALDQLIREDKEFAHKVLAEETWTRVELEGGDIEARKAETDKLAEYLKLK